MNVLEAIEYMKASGCEITVDTWKIRYKLFKNDIIGAISKNNNMPCADEVLKTWNIGEFVDLWKNVEKHSPVNLIICD